MFTKQKPQQQSTRRAISQRKEIHASAALEDKRAQTVQRQPNKTGLPDNLKSGMENLSGMSLDHVRVHYNSAKPAAVQAHAYAQGSDIHLASGQEKHLPHELGHVVQQAQGRVVATTSTAGMAVNDSPALEHEADELGASALRGGYDANLNAQSVRDIQCQTKLAQRVILRGEDSDTEKNINHGVVYKLSSEEIQNGIKIMKNMGEHDLDVKISGLAQDGSVKFGALNFYIGHWEEKRGVKDVAEEWVRKLKASGIKSGNNLVILACEGSKLASELSTVFASNGLDIVVTGATGLSYEYWDYSHIVDAGLVKDYHEVQIKPKHSNVGETNDGKDKRIKQWLEMRYDSLILKDMIMELAKILHDEDPENLNENGVNLLLSHISNSKLHYFDPHKLFSPFDINTEELVGSKGTALIPKKKIRSKPVRKSNGSVKEVSLYNKNTQERKDSIIAAENHLSVFLGKGLTYEAPEKVPYENRNMTLLMSEWGKIENDAMSGIVSKLRAGWARQSNITWSSIAANRYVKELVMAYKGNVTEEDGGSQVKLGWVSFKNGEAIAEIKNWRELKEQEKK